MPYLTPQAGYSVPVDVPLGHQELPIFVICLLVVILTVVLDKAYKII